MLVDSHCHLNFPDLIKDLPAIKQAMQAHQVGHALCISVTLEDFPQVLALAFDSATASTCGKSSTDTEIQRK